MEQSKVFWVINIYLWVIMESLSNSIVSYGRRKFSFLLFSSFLCFLVFFPEKITASLNWSFLLNAKYINCRGLYIYAIEMHTIYCSLCTSGGGLWGSICIGFSRFVETFWFPTKFLAVIYDFLSRFLSFD